VPLATGKIAKLMQNQSQQAADWRAIQATGNGLIQHCARFAGLPAIQRLSGFVQGAAGRAGCHAP